MKRPIGEFTIQSVRLMGKRDGYPYGWWLVFGRKPLLKKAKVKRTQDTLTLGGKPKHLEEMLHSGILDLTLVRRVY